jgi:hypothetical protein
VTAVCQEPSRTRFALTPLEIAGGLPLGMDDDEPHLPEAPAGLSPIAAFEDVVRSALVRPPCVVTFSGGRDSSAILAVAMRLARDEGHEPPVAVTLQFLADDTGIERDADDRTYEPPQLTELGSVGQLTSETDTVSEDVK